jgi:plasmid stabilization system protein ParE
MAVKLLLAPEADRDLTEAYGWYEERQCGLGEDFLSCVDAGLQSIIRMPEMYSVIYKNYRQALVRRFPYTVIYEWHDDVVTVYSVFHTSRDPDKWKKRLP